jgi:hypothetical protein
LPLPLVGRLKPTYPRGLIIITFATASGSDQEVVIKKAQAQAQAQVKFIIKSFLKTKANAKVKIRTKMSG